MVKICLDCHYVNAGGFRCVECGGRLVHTSDPEAKALPERVWKNQRVDYGARRGMIVRFVAIFAGAIVGLWCVRESVALAAPWSWIAGAASVALGLVVWWILHRAAGRGVRVWILAKGRVHKGRLARAALGGILPKRRRSQLTSQLSSLRSSPHPPAPSPSRERGSISPRRAPLSRKGEGGLGGEVS